MKCGMCEMHVKDAISKCFKVTKINASHIKNQVVVITKDDLSEDDFKNALDPTGYRVTSYKREDAKKTLFGWK